MRTPAGLAKLGLRRHASRLRQRWLAYRLSWRGGRLYRNFSISSGILRKTAPTPGVYLSGFCTRRSRGKLCLSFWMMGKVCRTPMPKRLAADKPPRQRYRTRLGLEHDPRAQRFVRLPLWRVRRAWAAGRDARGDHQGLDRRQGRRRIPRRSLRRPAGRQSALEAAEEACAMGRSPDDSGLRANLRPGHHFGVFAGPANDNEDCLYLNVFTPNLDPSARLPVIVWIQAAAMSTARPPAMTAARLAADGKTVVVTYRVSAEPDGLVCSSRVRR